jgi:hypothetical protein
MSCIKNKNAKAPFFHEKIEKEVKQYMEEIPFDENAPVNEQHDDAVHQYMFELNSTLFSGDMHDLDSLERHLLLDDRSRSPYSFHARKGDISVFIEFIVWFNEQNSDLTFNIDPYDFDEIFSIGYGLSGCEYVKQLFGLEG